MQAGRQFAAMLVTLCFAVVGGLVTGVILKQVARMQGDTRYRKGLTVARLALNIGNILEGIIPGNHNLPKDMMFDDDLYFAKEEEEEQVDSPWNDSFGVEYIHNVIFSVDSCWWRPRKHVKASGGP